MPPRALKKESREQKRNEILKIAGDLFSKQGFEGTSLWDIAERAQISDVQVYPFPIGLQN
jgi:AcrR family transcriptional regulator